MDYQDAASMDDQVAAEVDYQDAASAVQVASYHAATGQVARHAAMSGSTSWTPATQRSKQ